MDTTTHATAEQAPPPADGLWIFDDVHEVPEEPAALVGLRLMAVVLSYSFALGVLVLVLVPVVLALMLVLPYLPGVLVPGLPGR